MTRPFYLVCFKHKVIKHRFFIIYRVICLSKGTKRA